ncbi:MAG: UDP-glucose/GDP-mannose dehydrogenase family protein [Patescibacteria group bacterium]
MTITIIGAGYVGLVTAILFAELGNEVFCVDISKERISGLKKGEIPFFEPGLSEYIIRNNKEGRLKFTTSYNECVPKSDVVFICVGTPPGKNGEADLTYLFSAIEETARNLKGYTLIVIKSTFPIGFENDFEETVKKHAKDKFEFAASPEFLKEGTALEDAFHPDRIVIGTNSQRAQKLLLELHGALPGERIICDMRSAQLIKYASNSFLATKISFANALSVICEKTGADVEKVLQGVGADKRINHAFLKPGIGYGGSCLPKDVLAFIHQASTFDYSFDLLRSVDSINTTQIDRFIQKIRAALSAQEDKKANLQNFKIAILGLAFKPNTDDMRDAPSIKIINALLELKADIVVYDPQAMENAKKIINNVTFAKSMEEAITGCDAMVIVTDWPQFSELDLSEVKKLLRKPIIVDGRNIYSKFKLEEMGFTYFSIGR